MVKLFDESIKQDLGQTEENTTVCGMQEESSWFSFMVQNFAHTNYSNKFLFSLSTANSNTIYF